MSDTVKILRPQKITEYLYPSGDSEVEILGTLKDIDVSQVRDSDMIVTNLPSAINNIGEAYWKKRYDDLHRSAVLIHEQYQMYAKQSEQYGKQLDEYTELLRQYKRKLKVSGEPE